MIALRVSPASSTNCWMRFWCSSMFLRLLRITSRSAGNASLGSSRNELADSRAAKTLAWFPRSIYEMKITISFSEIGNMAKEVLNSVMVYCSVHIFKTFVNELCLSELKKYALHDMAQLCHAFNRRISFTQTVVFHIETLASKSKLVSTR